MKRLDAKLLALGLGLREDRSASHMSWWVVLILGVLLGYGIAMITMLIAQ